MTTNWSFPKIDKKFRENLASCSLLLPQRQNFLSNHLARVPFTPNQVGTTEMREEMLSSVGAQDMGTSRLQVSDLDDNEFYWANDQLDVDAVFRPGIDTSFSPTVSEDLEMRRSAENHILLHKKENKENSPSTTPVSERPTRHFTLPKSKPYGKILEIVSEYLYRNLFQ